MKLGRVVDHPDQRGDGLTIVCPHFAGLTVAEADLVGTLPIGDANGAVLALAGSFGRDPAVYAAILAADPFRPTPVLLGALVEAGVRAVINLPSVATIGCDLATALGHAGVDYAAELATLATARTMGLETMALATTADQARQAMAAGVTRILVWPRDEDIAAALDTARRGGAEVFLFHHPAREVEDAPLLALVDGIVDWAIAARPASLAG
jgi:predicted TIM-barrel enzyme